ncbi:hypothetical protein [Paraburkholderia strydomiana]
MAAVDALSSGNEKDWTGSYRLPDLQERELDVRGHSVYDDPKPVAYLNIG